MSEPLQLLLTGAPSASSLTACFPHSNLGHPDLVRLCHSSVQNPPVFSPLSRPREPPAATPPISDLPLTRSATQFFHQAVLLPSQGFCTCCSLCVQHCSPQIFIWLPPAQPSGLCLTALSLAEHPVSKVTPPSPRSPSASPLISVPLESTCCLLHSRAQSLPVCSVGTGLCGLHCSSPNFYAGPWKVVGAR